MNGMKVQFISHYTQRYSYLDSIDMALRGGCRWVQLRMKGCTTDEMRPVALEAQKMCREYGATFIIDDNVSLVAEIHADGVHLGRNDMPVAEAREILGAGYIIGGTANTFEDVEALLKAGADYVGCGPYRYTTTKKKLSPILGLEGYRSIVARMKGLPPRADSSTCFPIVAIGGIEFEDIAPILETGVNGIALSGAVLRAENPVQEMQRIVAECNIHTRGRK